MMYKNTIYNMKRELNENKTNSEYIYISISECKKKKNC